MNMELTPYDWKKYGITNSKAHPFRGSITKADQATQAAVELTINAGYVYSNLWNTGEETTKGIVWAITPPNEAFVNLPTNFSAYIHLECNDLEEYVDAEVLIFDDETDPELMPTNSFNHGYHKILSGVIVATTVGEVTTYSAQINEQLLKDNIYQDKANLVWYWWPSWTSAVNITIEAPV